MELRDIARAIRKRWWLVLIVPAVVGAGLFARARTLPYQVTTRATVLIPGDTEIPGSAERPELMVLDDLPALVSSRVFAQAVQASGGDALAPVNVGDIEASLSASRYSRVLTVKATNGNSNRAAAIAAAAAAVLPAQVNTYLVADQSKPATVQIIDPPGDPTRRRANDRFVYLAQVLVALGVGVGLALAADALGGTKAGDPVRPAVERPAAR